MTRIRVNFFRFFAHSKTGKSRRSFVCCLSILHSTDFRCWLPFAASSARRRPSSVCLFEQTPPPSSERYNIRTERASTNFAITLSLSLLVVTPYFPHHPLWCSPPTPLSLDRIYSILAHTHISLTPFAVFFFLSLLSVHCMLCVSADGVGQCSASRANLQRRDE